MTDPYFDHVVQVGQLYLEDIFWEYESEPILFTCHDHLNEIYLCLCSDIRHGQKWIITKCNTKILKKLLTEEIDIVTAFLKQQKAIVIDMDLDGKENSYEANTKEIDSLDLPEPGTFIREKMNVKKIKKMTNEIFYQDNQKRFYYDYIFFEATYPIFFSCTDEKNIYIVTLCDNRKELRWILAQTAESQLVNIMKNKITMYDVYLNSDTYYVITKKHNIMKCELCDDKSINKIDFPTKGEYFEADEEELADYMAHINNK